MKKYLAILIAVFLFQGCNLGTQKDTKTIAVATFVDHVVLNKIRDSFREEMNELGYTKENGYQIIIKSANGQQSEAVAVAEDLLNMNPVVIVSISTPATKPVFDKNNGRLPLVYSFVSFPESIGITPESKNVTGLSDGVDFMANFELMKKIIPEIKRIGMVYSDEPNAIISKDRMLEICRLHSVEFIAQAISREDEVRQAAQTIAGRGVDLFFVGADGVVVNQINAMIDVSNAHRIPLFATDEGSIEAGGFAALSVNYDKFGRETARVADKVIKAGNANEIEHQEYFGDEIVINLKTARRINISVPDSIVLNAYKIID
jgi:putative tryptophan/tyrosine transport system substrate-binding protein